MTEQDIRWKQRFQNYCRALDQLTRFMDRDELNELEEQGLIQSFEYNHELAWKTLKDFLEYQGESDIIGSRDVSRIAFRLGLLGGREEDGQIWLDMIIKRNLTSHTYNEETAREIINAITDHYYDAFCKLRDKLAARLDGV